MNVLYIDTHDKEINLIIFQNNKILTNFSLSNFKHQSEEMLNSVNKVLLDSKLAINDLNEIWVINGPGSFTSIRIGITVAKTLAYCLNIPIKSSTYLELLAFQIDNPNKIIEMPEKNGHFIAEYENNKLLSQFYLSKTDYKNYSQTKDNLFENIKLDSTIISNYFTTLENQNCFDVNPIYIKKIGVLSD